MSSIGQELIMAARENSLPEVRRLLRAGADVNAEGDEGETPLHWASCEGHVNVQVVVELLKHGADIEAKDDYGRTPLYFACGEGHLVIVNELLSPNDSNDATTFLGKRKSHGENIDVTSNHGNTPLHLASLKGHLPVVKALVSGGADILARNNDVDGGLPIHVAVTGRKSEVTKYLLQHFYATIWGNLPLHQLLKDLTWIGNSNGDPSIHLLYAIHQDVLGTDDVVEIIEYLVDTIPALPSSPDQDGSLPLHVACRRGASFAIVQSLVNLYKASVKSVTPQGDLPLFLACEMPETSLDTIFILMKLHPDLVYR
jgi:ankyrin repeat protein